MKSHKLVIGGKYRVKVDLADAPSTFVRGEILVMLRENRSAIHGHVVCEFRAKDNSVKYLDLTGPSERDWRDILAPADWLG